MGFTSFGYGEERQANGTCRSYREALAQPDIVGYVTNRYMDTALPCLDIDACLGLRTRDGRYKLAWHHWSAMDRISPYGCGFELRDSNGEIAVLLEQYLINGRHWATTRTPVRDPPLASESWRLLRGNAGIETQSAATPPATTSRYDRAARAAPRGWSQLESLGYGAGSVKDVGLTEGDSGTRDAVFEVSLLQPFYEPVVVSYATANGTATRAPITWPHQARSASPPGPKSRPSRCACSATPCLRELARRSSWTSAVRPGRLRRAAAE